MGCCESTYGATAVNSVHKQRPNKCSLPSTPPPCDSYAVGPHDGKGYETGTPRHNNRWEHLPIDLPRDQPLISLFRTYTDDELTAGSASASLATLSVDLDALLVANGIENIGVDGDEPACPLWWMERVKRDPNTDAEYGAKAGSRSNSISNSALASYSGNQALSMSGRQPRMVPLKAMAEASMLNGNALQVELTRRVTAWLLCVDPDLKLETSLSHVL